MTTTHDAPVAAEAAVPHEARRRVRPPGERARIFSGMQPTGTLHIGNWIGALKNWIELARDPTRDTIYCVVDYHAITVEYDPPSMARRVREMVVDWLGAGLDPERSTIFVQSSVPAHTELAWIFNSLAMIGRLENMTQFKDKSAQHRDNVNAGLFTYPILQAADILLYRAEGVPVGDDQDQHLELTREIARRFNYRFGPVFPEPATLHTPTPRVLGLDGVSKMSKSAGNHIGLRDTAAETTEKLTKRAASDTNRKRRSDPGDPSVCYVFQMHGIFTPEDTRNEIAAACRGATIGCFDCKKRLADRVNEALEPVRAGIDHWSNRPADVRDILETGGARCRAVAAHTIEEVRSSMGLGIP